MKAPNIELLEILIAAAESKNLFQAAEKLQVSQPLVSLKLKELQAQVPLPVFSYEGRRKVLTHYGRELYKIAKNNKTRIFSDFEVLNRNYAKAEALTIKVGSRRDLFEALAPKLMFSGCIHFYSMTSREAIEKLLNHKIDVAIAYERPDSSEIVAKKILESSARFAVHKKFLRGRLAEEVAVDRDFLVENPCVLYSGLGHLLRDWAAHLLLPMEKLKIRAIVEDWRSVQTLVDQGWGYSIIPSYIASTNTEVVTIDLPTSILPKLIFYTLFHKELKRISAFHSLLEFKA